MYIYPLGASFQGDFILISINIQVKESGEVLKMKERPECTTTDREHNLSFALSL
jgi:hypothetical protein